MNDHFDRLADTWDSDPMKIKRSKTTAAYCRKAPLKVKKKLLDFGGGTGLLSLFLHDTFDQVTIVDSSKEMLRVAQEKIDASTISNIKTLKIKEDLSEVTGSHSAIITLMTLHHIRDIDRFFQTASTILEDHGALIIADLYLEDGSFHKHIEDFDGHNGFDIDALSSKLNQAGFRVTQVSSYFEIRKEISDGDEKVFPLFFLVAEKDVKQTA